MVLSKPKVIKRNVRIPDKKINNRTRKASLNEILENGLRVNHPRLSELPSRRLMSRPLKSLKEEAAEIWLLEYPSSKWRLREDNTNSVLFMTSS